MIYSRRIQIIPITNSKEEFNQVYKKVRDFQYFSYKCANEIMNHLILNNFMKNKMKEKKIDKNEISENIKEIYKSKSEQNIPYKITNKYKKELPSTVRSCLGQRVYQDFKNDVKEILCGNKSIRNYKREKMNLYFQFSRNPFKIEGDKYIFNWISKIKFKFNFGRDKSNNKIVIDRILLGEYKIKDSYIKLIKKKLFLFLSVDIPIKENRRLNKEIIVGIDVGYSCLAYCGLNKGLSRLVLGKNDTENSIQFNKKKMISHKKDLQKRMKLSNGGRGRNKKLKYLENYKEKERNFMQTKNHQISAEIIKFAIKNNAGIIQMENLTGIQDDIENSWLKRNWTYYQLQQMIDYKAKMNGIEVRYVNPKNTSKMCSKCGKIKENLKLENRMYECDCGNLLDRDYNASVNIANSMNYSEKSVRKSSENRLMS